MAFFEDRTRLETVREIEESLAECSFIDASPRRENSRGKLMPISSKSQQTFLLRFPPEIRQHVYDYIFHAPVPVPQKEHQLRIEDHRGYGLSLACSQLYRETRFRYFNSACYYFTSPKRCLEYLIAAGPNVQRYVGSLHICINSELSEFGILRNLFNLLLPVSGLHSLQLDIRGSGFTYKKPMYFSAARLSNPPLFYDIFFRPPYHPLAKFKSIRNLIIEGSPNNSELEEAVLKLSLYIEDTARLENRLVKAEEEYIRSVEELYFPTARPAPRDWFYSLEVGPMKTQVSKTSI